MAGLLTGVQRRTPPGQAGGAPIMSGPGEERGEGAADGAAEEAAEVQPGQGERPNVSPEEQAQYDRFIDMAFRLIYDQKSFPQILKRLTATPDPVEGLAATVVMVVSRLRDSAKRQGVEISPDVLYHGGSELLEDLADTAEKAGIHRYGPEEMEKALYRALDLYRSIEQRAGADPRAFRQDWEMLVSADKEGRLGEVLPQFAQGGQGGGQPWQQQAPDEPQPGPPSRGLLRQPPQGGM
jgi:hypothetical protein